MSTTIAAPEVETAEATRHTLFIMDGTGDTRITWDPTNATEVEMAREAFEKAKENRYLAYTTDRAGNKGEVIRDFDPEAGDIVMSPQLVGG